MKTYIFFREFRSIVLLLILVFNLSSGWGKSLIPAMETRPPFTDTVHSDSTYTGEVHDIVEEMPQFPGGPSAMFEYMNKNLKYPEEAKTSGVQGRVLVTFIIERDGSLSNVKVVKSVSPSLDKEAIRVVSSMPKWIPGKQYRSAVRVKYTVPVTFKL